jgi:hypothetical protein
MFFRSQGVDKLIFIYKINQDFKNAKMSINAKIYSQKTDFLKTIWILSVENSADEEFTFDSMNWNGINNFGTNRIKFDSKENAILFAKKNNLNYSLEDPSIRFVKKKSYDENFK